MKKYKKYTFFRFLNIITASLVIGTMFFNLLTPKTLFAQDKNNIVAESIEKQTPNTDKSAKEEGQVIDETENKVTQQPDLTVNGSKVSFNNSFGVSDNETLNFGVDIDEGTGENTIIAYSHNQAPVAGLQYLVLNPNSLINGQITTDTQIAWLWSHNGKNFTYDSDRDKIVSKMVDGIPSNAIIGNITDGLGFVTQFSTPAQYQMTYQVKDSKGALSNVSKFVINIEPTNGNTRPIININTRPITKISDQKLNVYQLIKVSWAKSYDNDPNDAVYGISGIIYKNGVNTNMMDYIQYMTDDYMILSFKEEGEYEIWSRVWNKQNAYSNWVIIPINVKKTLFGNITRLGHTEP